MLRPAELSLHSTVDTAISLRSDALWRLSDDQIAERVDVLVRARRAGLATHMSAPQSGRLLAYDPGANLADGFAEVQSAGFFDGDNAPPWDTWITLVQNEPRSPTRWSAWDSYVVAWVPTALLSNAQRGIDVNPEECMRWLHEIDLPTVQALEAAARPRSIRFD